MTTEEKKLMAESSAPQDGSKDEVMELSVDEQSHVAGGSSDKLGRGNAVHKIESGLKPW
jgi:hypothetical protein